MKSISAHVLWQNDTVLSSVFSISSLNIGKSSVTPQWLTCTMQRTTKVPCPFALSKTLHVHKQSNNHTHTHTCVHSLVHCVNNLIRPSPFWPFPLYVFSTWPEELAGALFWTLPCLFWWALRFLRCLPNRSSPGTTGRALMRLKMVTTVSPVQMRSCGLWDSKHRDTSGVSKCEDDN